MKVNMSEILLVEDDQDHAQLIIRELKKAGVINGIAWVKDGREALDYLTGQGVYQENPGIPLLILLDIKLPKLNGVEVLRAIKKDGALNKIPVVMLTTSSNDQEIETCYRLGANSYVVKPVKFSEFAERVREVGLYWLLVNTPPKPSQKEQL